MGLVGSNPTLSAIWSKKVGERSHTFRRWGGFALYGALYGIISWICYRRIDPDFGWHLQAGRYIAVHGVPAHDIFTYTARGFPWIDHEWLSDVFMSWCYRLDGRLGVGLAFGAVWTAAIGLAARRRWPVAALATVGLLDVMFARPLAFTALLLVVEIAIWYRQPQRRWLLVPLFLVWANLHGGFSLGLAALAFLLVWERQWRWWWLLPLAIAATFINPYGPRLYVEIWRTLSDLKLSSQVTEWGPLPLSIPVALYMVTALFGMIWQGSWRSTIGIMSGGLLVAGVVSARQYMPFVMVSLPLVAQAYVAGVGRLRSLKAWLVPTITASVAIVLAMAFVRQLPIINYYPVAAVAALRQQPCQGHIFNNYNFGGYLIWQLPGVPVYIDGRMPSWKGPQGYYIDRYFAVLSTARVAQQEFARYNIHCAILYNHQQPLSGLLKREGWRVAAKDQTATLWRNDRPQRG